MKSRLKIFVILLIVLLLALFGLLYYQYVYYPSFGTVSITTKPQGVRVSIDLEEVGVTPLEFKDKAGRYMLKLEKEGFKTLEQEIEIIGGGFEVYGFILEEETEN